MLLKVDGCFLMFLVKIIIYFLEVPGRKKQLKTQLSVLKVSRSNLELELERTKLSLAEIEKKRAELKSRRDEISRVLKVGELWEKKISEEIAQCPAEDNGDSSDDETVDNYSTVGADDSGYEFSDSLHELKVLESLLSNKPLPQIEPTLTSNTGISETFFNCVISVTVNLAGNSFLFALVFSVYVVCI
jgi:hypothetical protein